MILALVVRRFSVKTNGDATLAEATKILDLPIPPERSALVDFGDDTGQAAIMAVLLHASSNRAPGLYPPAVEIRTATEPGDRMEAALAAGWRPLPSPA